MKKFLTSLFVGGYNTKIFGKTITITRPANIIVLSFLIHVLFDVNNEYSQFYSLIPLVVSLYFGFLHFRLFPAKVENMSAMQKAQLIQSETSLGDNEYDFDKLKKDTEVVNFKKEHSEAKFYQVPQLLLIPLAVLITTIIITLN